MICYRIVVMCVFLSLLNIYAFNNINYIIAAQSNTIEKRRQFNNTNAN